MRLFRILVERTQLTELDIIADTLLLAEENALEMVESEEVLNLPRDGTPGAPQHFSMKSTYEAPIFTIIDAYEIEELE